MVIIYPWENGREQGFFFIPVALVPNTQKIQINKQMKKYTSILFSVELKGIR